MLRINHLFLNSVVGVSVTLKLTRVTLGISGYTPVRFDCTCLINNNITLVIIIYPTAVWMVLTIFKIESDCHRIAHSVQKRTTRKMASSYPGLLPGKSINSNRYSLQSIISSLPSIASGVPFVGSQNKPNFFVTSWKVNHILLLLLPIWFSLPIYNLL